MTALPVTYRLSSVSSELDLPEEPMSGETQNISAGGMLLHGHLPDPDVVTELLMKRVAVYVELQLPGTSGPLKALGRVSWLDSIDVESGIFSLGLEFKEITKESQDRIIEFILQSMMS